MNINISIDKNLQNIKINHKDKNNISMTCYSFEIKESGFIIQFFDIASAEKLIKDLKLTILDISGFNFHLMNSQNQKVGLLDHFDTVLIMENGNPKRYNVYTVILLS